MTGIEALNAICAECQQDKGKIQVACPWRSISGDYCEEYETLKRSIERLAELEDKIEDGRLKEFPCKVGDVVWFIKTTGFKPELIKTTVEKLVVKNGVYLKLACNSFYETSAKRHGMSGVPSIRELVEDADAIKEMYEKLAMIFGGK